MFDLLIVLMYIGGFMLALAAAMPMTAVVLWVYERITGKDVLDCEEFENEKV